MVQVDGGALNVDNSVFANNSAGAINVASGATASITNGSVLYNNTKTGQGGAIYNAGNVNIDGAKVINNTASNGGGAIYNTTSGLLKVSNTDFINNVSQNNLDGGAIRNEDGIVVVENSYFYGNVGGQNGDAIRNTNQMTIIDSVFENNRRYDAVFNTSDAVMNVIADTEGILFKDNGNGINNAGTVNFNAKTGTSVVINDVVIGSGIYNLNNTGLSYTTLNDNLESDTVNITQTGGTYQFNNNVNNGTFNLYNNAQVKLGSYTPESGTTTYGKLNLTAFTNDANGGTVDSQNNHIDTNSMGVLTLGSNLETLIDIDLANTSADIISATTANVGSNKVNINNINWYTDNTALVDVEIALTNANYNLANAITLGSDVSQYTNGFKVYNLEKVVKDNIAYLTFAFGNLYTAVHDTTTERTYTLSQNEPALAEGLTGYGNMEGENATLTIEGTEEHHYGVKGNNKSGITVNNGQTLNVQHIGSATITKDADGNYTFDETTGEVTGVTVNNSWSGFGGDSASLTAKKGANINITDSVFAENTKKLLNIASGGNVSVVNSAFVNNATVSLPSVGAALISNAGTLSLDGVKFINNTIDETVIRFGGIIYNKAGTISAINDSDFIGNKFSTNGGQSTTWGLWGGVITNIKNSTITSIKDTNFIGNTVFSTQLAPHGGVIHNEDSTIGIIDNVVFEISPI